MSTTKTVRLTLDITYETNGESLGELISRLEDAVHRCVGEGMLTGDTAAEVETWTAKVVETEPPINEDELAAFMSRRIEDGEWDLEDIPVRLARYGQMESTAFIAEMRERMELEQECRASPDQSGLEAKLPQGVSRPVWSRVKRRACLASCEARR